MTTLLRLTAALLAVLSLPTAMGQSAARALPPSFAIRATVQRPEGEAEPASARILFNAKDERNMYALVVGASEARLVRVLDGEESVLVGPTAIPTDGALPVLVVRDPNRIACWVGAAKLSARDESLTGGRAGRAVSEGGLAISDWRVQPVEPVEFADDFMRGEGDPDPWSHLAGSWELDRVPNPTWSANAFRYVGRGAGPCLAAAGEWFWHDVVVSASVVPGTNCGAVGVASCVEDARNYLTLRWRSPAGPALEGTLEIVQVRDGEEKVLARAAGNLDPVQPSELALAVRGDLAVAFVDGVQALQARGDLRCGRAGLTCRDAERARFDDVRVASVSLSEEELVGDAARAILPIRRASVAERFRTDIYMQQWASELGSWLPDGKGTYWHTGLFRGDFELVWEADEAMLFEQGPVAIVAAGDDRDPARGSILTLARTGETVTATLIRQGQPGGEWKLDLPAARSITSLSLKRRDGTTEVSIADQPVAEYSDALAVTQIGLQCRWTRKRTLMHYATTSVSQQEVAVPAVQNFECTGPLLLDYSFHDAPVDWRADAGTWEVTSRWICLPYFTWLGGQSHEAAILWHKRRFTGDVTLDLYAAVMMNYGPYSGYDRYGDLNVTLCADGRDLSSGYSAQFGGLANTTTRILRGDKVVAETDSILYPSRNAGAHNNWYHVRLEKRGARVRLFVDNRLACEYTDPEPLAGRHLAIWTWNRGLMIARARVWAERDEGAPPAFGQGRLPALLADPASPRREVAWSWARGPLLGRGQAEPERASAPFRIASTSHPSAFFGFDRDAEGWANRTGEHGGRVRWEPRDAGGCLRVENPTTGGDLAVHPPLEPFDAREFQRLAFDYRLPSDVRINLYLRVAGRWHVVGLTAPTDTAFHAIRESREISGRVTATSGLQIEEPPPLDLGRVGVTADDTWRRAEFDLLAALRRTHPDQQEFVVDGLHFGNWSNRDYLQCGFGGNRRGAAFWLDNVFLGRHGGQAGRFEWEQELPWVIDVSPTAYPTNAAARKASADALASGTCYLHLGDGDDVRHHPFLVDADPPRVESVEPKAGAKAAPTALTLVIADPGGSGIEPRSVRVTVDGAPVAADVRTDGVVAGLSGCRFKSGQTVSCEVAVADRAGNAMAAPFRWQWTYDRSLDKSPPSVPALTSPAPSGWDEDFETPSDEWCRSPGSPWVDLSLDASTSSSGGRCLRIEGGPGPFRCFVRRRAFDIKARPTLSFDYLADPGARWSLAFLTDAGWRNYSPRASSRRESAAADWQHVDLRVDHMLAIVTKGKAPVVRAIAVFGSDQRAGRTAVVRLDAMRLLPAVFTGREITLRWTADDPSGIEGYSFVLDHAPDTVPDTTADGSEGEGTFPNVPSGTAYFHCRAVDGAGNWGPTLHQALVVQRTTDAEPPQVAGVSPESGDRAAPDTLSVRIQDAGAGLSVERFRLHVAGKAYDMDSPELRFLPAEGEVRWTAPQRPAFPDGAAVLCRLEATDHAGNALKPLSWSWTLDFAQDKTPPGAPFVTWAPEGALVFQDFERDQGQWIGRREGWAERTDEDAATGSHCVRFGGMSTFLHYERYDAGRFPIVGFDYRLAPGSRLDLMCRIENRNWQIQLTGASRYPLIGAVPGIVADGQWHSCRFDLAEMLRNARVPPVALFVDHLATQNRVGEPFHADNFYIAPAGVRGVRVQWSVPRDPTGIKGYSVVLDRKPDTVPDTTVNSTEPQREYTDLERGAWYAHVRACDGAGNWGAPGHAKIVVASP